MKDGKQEPGLVQVSYHARLGPDTPGNPGTKASWRFRPDKCGSWPFIVGNIWTAKAVFALEGQWDALSLIDVMGWINLRGLQPISIAVVGVRGATSWKKFLDCYAFAKGATLFGIAQSDEAGERWFAENGFLEKAEEKFDRVHGFSPSIKGYKDFNDLVKAGLVDGEALAERFRRELRKKQ